MQTILQFLDHLSKVRNYSENTVTAYGFSLNSLGEWLQSSGSTTAWSRVTRHDIRDYIMECVDSGLSANTINQRLAAFRTFFKWLRMYAINERNPFNYPEDPMAGVVNMKSPALLPKFIPQSTMNHLLDVVLREDTAKQLRTRCAVMLFYHTGCRFSEVLHLRWADVDLGRKVILVTGKGDKMRYVPFGDELCGILSRWQSVCPNTSGAVFTSMDGHPLEPFQLRELIKVALRAVVPAEYAHPHILRHSIATHLLDNGANLMYISRFLGHASVKTTEIYTHVTLDMMRRNIAILNR